MTHDVPQNTAPGDDTLSGAPEPWERWETSLVLGSLAVGCVGLVKKDFHILNVGYSRKEYFEILEKLKRELGVR